ncbi:hypothetical protein B0H11DRAFT_2187253 [Mycena galericulata]|nr:hypothetical protein B0H11DRAFT_2187253 [Mycena galericulata]
MFGHWSPVVATIIRWSPVEIAGKRRRSGPVKTDGDRRNPYLILAPTGTPRETVSINGRQESLAATGGRHGLGPMPVEVNYSEPYETVAWQSWLLACLNTGGASLLAPFRPRFYANALTSKRGGLISRKTGSNLHRIEVSINDPGTQVADKTGRFYYTAAATAGINISASITADSRQVRDRPQPPQIRSIRTWVYRPSSSGGSVKERKEGNGFLQEERRIMFAAIHGSIRENLQFNHSRRDGLNVRKSCNLRIIRSRVHGEVEMLSTREAVSEKRNFPYKKSERYKAV